MRRGHALLLVAMAFITTGCSLFQPNAHDPADASANRVDCDWTPVRGVAELVRIEDNTAVMDFFPGEIRFRTRMRDTEWAPGDEFKVLLETSDHPECDAPRVRKLSPVGPDA